MKQKRIKEIKQLCQEVMTSVATMRDALNGNHKEDCAPIEQLETVKGNKHG